MKNIVIVGGGIIGLSSAYYLQRAGHRVTVLDKDDFSDNCSYGNMGYICPSHFIPLAAPGIIWKGLKWMFNSNSPFYVQPSFNPALINWGWNFKKSATRKHVAAAAIPLRDISILSKSEYEAWAGMPGFDFAFEHKGLLEIFQTQKVGDHAMHTYEQAKRLGLDVSFLNAAELSQKEPQTTINALGAVYFKCDSHVYPDELMSSLKSHLKQNDVSLVPGETVKGFEKKAGRISGVLTQQHNYPCDEVIIASGSWSRELAAKLETTIPMMPGRGYSFTLENSPYKLNHPAILTEGRVAITPMDGNKIRFGGTMEVVPTDTPPRYSRVRGIVKTVKRFLPEFDMPVPTPEKIWFGFRPCSADGLPYIGRTKKYRNAIIATGHSMLGLSLGAGTGKLVGELVDELQPSVNLKSFSPGRFE